MILSISAPAFYRQAGFGLLLASFALFALALPPFQAGIWIQTEPVVLGLQVLVAAAALWMACGLWLGWLTPQRIHPVWMILLLWALWQFIVSVMAPSFSRSWFGPPETGEGVAWHFAIPVLTMLVSLYWNDLRLRRIILLVAGLTMALQALLHWCFPLGEGNRYIPGSWTPAAWPSYIAFMAGYTWLALAVAGMMEQRKHRLMLFAGLVAILYASGNKSGILLLICAGLLSTIVPELRSVAALKRFCTPGERGRKIALLTCLLPLLWYPFSAFFPSIKPYTDRLETLEIIFANDSSLGSRVALNRIAFSVMKHEPLRWLAGIGWGGYTDDAFNYALLDDVHVFHDGERAPNFMLVDGYSFHSHSQPLEAMLSLGLPGFLLWFALPLLLLALIPLRLFWSCVPVLIGLVGIAFLWFELVQCVPYKALALAALMSAMPYEHRWAPAAPQRLAWLWLVVAVAMGWTAYEQRGAMRYGMQLRDAAHALPFEDYPDEWVASDLRRGGDRFRSSALFFAGWLELKTKIGGLDDNDRGWYARFMQVARAAAQEEDTPARVSMLEVWMKYNLLASLEDPIFNELREDMLSTLPDAVIQLAHISPLRDDLAAAFLMNLPSLTEGDSEAQEGILNALLEAAPNHRGALWLLGGLLEQTEDRKEEGVRMRKKAVELGVERVLPLKGDALAVYK